MKRILIFIILIVPVLSCKKELVKWEFVSTPVISENGPFTNSTLNIEKTITKNDIINKLGLENIIELRELRIKEASINILINEEIPQADSLEYYLYCDAIPLVTTYKGVIKIKPGTLSKDLAKEKFKLLGVSLPAIEFVNSQLKSLISKNTPVRFELLARALPSGSTVTGYGDVYISFDVVYWKCIEAPEVLILSDSHKGPCN